MLRLLMRQPRSPLLVLATREKCMRTAKHAVVLASGDIHLRFMGFPLPQLHLFKTLLSAKARGLEQIMLLAFKIACLEGFLKAHVYHHVILRLRRQSKLAHVRIFTAIYSYLIKKSTHSYFRLKKKKKDTDCSPTAFHVELFSLLNKMFWCNHCLSKFAHHVENQ